MSIKSCRPLPKHTGSGLGGTHAGLSQEFVDKAVRRLGLIGLLSAIGHPILRYGSRLAIPEDVLRTIPDSAASTLALWVAVVLGLAIYGLTRIQSLNRATLIDI